MDDDPWADAPPSPRPPSFAESPSKAIPGPSKLARAPSPQPSPQLSPAPEAAEEPPTSSTSLSEPDHPESTPNDNDPSSKSPALPDGSQMNGDHGSREDLAEPIPDQAVERSPGEQDDFDDFDDFDEPTAGPSTDRADGGAAFVSAAAAGEEDAFGDFGDFEEGDFGSGDVEEGAARPLPSSHAEETQARWSALNLRPFPPKSELLQQLTELLSPLHESASTAASSSMLTDEPVRMVGGLSQVMVAESSRDAYAQLTTAPILKPLDWTRSRVRRDHLISMGVPVNLDEVDSHRLSALPPLRITTGDARHMPPPRTASLDTGNRSSSRSKGKERERDPEARSQAESEINGNGGGNGDAEGRNGSNKGRYGLGEKPELNMGRAEELCGLEEDRLSILSLASLKILQEDIVSISAQASAQLAWQLQLKDAQTQDSATYNGMISELIANAAKAKSAQQAGSGGGVFRRSSQRVSSMPAGRGSGTSTPRIASPALR